MKTTISRYLHYYIIHTSKVKKKLYQQHIIRILDTG